MATLSSPSQRFIAEAVSYALTQGIVMNKQINDLPPPLATHAPFTLQPSLVDRTSYLLARRLAPLLNHLLFRIADDHVYLRSALQETAAADPLFTGKLLDLLLPPPTIQQQLTTPIDLAIFRHDFFVHQPTPQDTPVLRMVEMNCIASSFAALSAKISHMHSFFADHPATDHLPHFNAANIPENNPLLSLANGIAQAHRCFCERHPRPPCTNTASSTPHTQTRVRAIMVVQPGERNFCDQDLLRFALWQHHKVEMVRLTLAEINAFGSLTEDNCLRIVGYPPCIPEFVASVVYFRAGYTPADYPSDKEWAARSLIETSNAVSCPSVAVQLVGTKKIQQILDTDGAVERFIDDPKDVALIRSSFARQYSLSPGPAGDEIVQRVIDDHLSYVLKPQREGGGNNLYADDMRKALQRMSPRERSAYILMERLRPVIVRNVLVRDGKAEECDIVSELGVFGVVVRCDGKVLSNVDGGTLLRSKRASDNDGGVAAGVAYLDSALLSDS